MKKLLHVNALQAVAVASLFVGTSAYAQETAAPAPAGHNGLTLNGAVGLTLNPTAQIPATKSWRVQGDYVDLGDSKSSTFGSTRLRFWGLHAAGRPWDAPIEISGGVEKLDVGSNDPSVNDADKTGLAIGAKWQAWKSETGDASVAVGAGYSRVLAKNTHAYLVGSKAFNIARRNVTGHLGVRYDRFDVDDIVNVSTSSKVSVYAGAEVPITSDNTWVLAGELQSKNNEFNNGLFGDIRNGDAKSQYSLAVRYQKAGWGAQAGIARRGYPGVSNDSGLFVQVGKTF